MFSSDSKKQKLTMAATSQQNIIAHGTNVIGDITSNSPFRIDGSIEGNISTDGKIVIGKQGKVKGNLQGVNVDIEGTFSGKLELKGTLSLKSSAQIEGEVIVNKLAVEPGATFNATCSMKGAVKALNNGKATVSKNKQDSGKTA